MSALQQMLLGVGAAGGGSSWTQTLVWTPTSSEDWGGGVTLRFLIYTSNLVAGSQVRFTLTAGSAGAADVTNSYCQLSAASSYPFSTTPIQVTKAGSGTFSIPAGTSIVTDPITIGIDGTVRLVLSVYFSGNGHIAKNAAGSHSVFMFYKVASDAATVAATGYSGGFNTDYFVTKIEILQP